MSLIICKECGHHISNYAETCPNCGIQVKKRKQAIDYGALVIAIISLIGSFVVTTISSRYTANATIEAARISAVDELDKSTDLGNALYKERSIYKGKGLRRNVVKSYPYGDGNAKNTLEDISAKEFVIEAAVLNIYNNVWYRIEKDVNSALLNSASGESFLFSDDVFYYKDAALVEWQDNHFDGANVSFGNEHALDGTIVCTNRIVKINVEIIGKSELFHRKFDLVLPIDDIYSYSMSNSELNRVVSVLPVENDYKMVVSVSYYTNGEKEVNTQTIEALFNIVSTN